MRISLLSPLNLAVVVSVISSFLSVLAARVPAPGISPRNDTLAAGLHAREGVCGQRCVNGFGCSGVCSICTGGITVGTCVQCRPGYNSDCPAQTPFCRSGSCTECGQTVACPSDRPICLRGDCVVCGNAFDCPSRRCLHTADHRGMCACLNNDECSARDSTKPICAQSGLCVPACNGQDDCPDPTTYCNVDAGSCLKIQCQSNDDCYSQKPTCYAPQNGTSFCGTNDQCGTDTDCMSKGFLSRNPHCLNPGPNSSCVGCITSSQCVAGNLNTCKSNSCVQCIDSTQCSVGQMCQDNRCKCIDDSGCLPSQQCQSGQCFGFLCTNSSQCPAGLTCQGVVCLPAPNA